MRKYDGFVNIDINPKFKPDRTLDITKGLPFEDNSVEHILAFDILEHIPREKSVKLWNEMYRVCKGGALIEIKTPDAKSDLFYIDLEHVTGYLKQTFERLQEPDELMGYVGRMKITQLMKDSVDNIIVNMGVIK